MFKINKNGKANPKNAAGQKICGDIYFATRAINELIIIM